MPDKGDKPVNDELIKKRESVALMDLKCRYMRSELREMEMMDNLAKLKEEREKLAAELADKEGNNV